MYFQTIDKVMKLETDFFPLIAGELGASKDSSTNLKARLDEFLPHYKVLSLFDDMLQSWESGRGRTAGMS